MLSGMWAGDLADDRCEEQSYCSEDLMFVIFLSAQTMASIIPRIAYTAGVHKAASCIIPHNIRNGVWVAGVQVSCNFLRRAWNGRKWSLNG